MGQREHQLAESYLAAVNPHLEEAPAFALLDFPDHSNVGDAAIFLGELEIFAKTSLSRPAYVSQAGPFLSSVGNRCPEGPLFLHGGGNFGDLWPRHHSYRLRVIERYRDRRIVQLPQTLHFRNRNTLDATARAIGRHRDFHLMVRDTASLAFAQKHFDCAVSLVPDAAHALTWDSVGDGSGVLILARADKERRGQGLASLMKSHGRVEDWAETREARRPALTPWQAIRSQFGMAASGMLLEAFEARSQQRVAAGMALLSSAEVVVSDRLHAHILCEVISKPHVVVDNSYGKVSSYIETWGASPNTAVAETPEMAPVVLEELLNT